MRISRHHKRPKGHARVQKSALKELLANSSWLVHGIGVGESVTNKLGGVISRRLSQARLQYLDFIMEVTSLGLNFRKVTLERTLGCRLEEIRLETRKIILWDCWSNSGEKWKVLNGFQWIINGYSRDCQHPPVKDHQIHMFSWTSWFYYSLQRNVNPHHEEPRGVCIRGC